MVKNNQYQSSFATGEISPFLFGRTDVEEYKAALRTAINMVVIPFGSVTRRPGFKYVRALEDQTKTARLISFEYSNEQTYQLEFAPGSIRFYKDQGIVLQSRDLANGDFTSDISSWTDNSSGTGAISHDAVNGRLTLTGGGGGDEARATSEALPNYGTGAYSVSVDVYTSTTTYKVGTTSGGSEIATGTITTGTGKTFTFTPTTNGTVYITFENEGTSSIDNVFVTDTTPYKIDTPYAEADIDSIRVDQSFDTVYIVHPNYAPRKLVRNNHDNWVLSTIAFSEPAWLDQNETSTTLTPSGTSGSITVTASGNLFTSTDVGRGIRLKSGPDTTNRVKYTGTGSQTYFEIPFYPQTSDDIEVFFISSTGAKVTKTYDAGTPGVGEFTIANGFIETGDTATTSEQVIIQPKNAGSGQWGWMTITGYTSPTQVTCSVQRTLGGTNATTYWRLGAWSGTTGYPSIVTLHQQRLWLANTISQPDTLWGSRVADYENFQPDDDSFKGIPEASSGVTYTLTTASIQFLAGVRELLAGCKNGLIPLIGSNGTIEATSQTITRLDGNYKCEFKQPVRTADEIIFIEDLKKKINSAKYNYSDKDGFQVIEMTAMSDHIVGRSSYKDIAWADTPHKVLWVIKDDGTLASCTFKANQNIIAWARHEIGGDDAEVESISVIPGDGYSELWAIIKRTIDGTTKRYVEVMQPYFYLFDKEEAFFVDSGLTYTGVPADVISGLDHLEGQSVTVLADGKYIPNEMIVSGGEITLPLEASVVTVGLGYVSDLELVNQEGGSRIGSTQMLKSKINKIGIRMLETLNIQYGIAGELATPSFRSGSDPMDSSPPLFTGDKIYDFDGDWKNNYRAYIRQDKPYPMTILGVSLLADIADG